MGILTGIILAAAIAGLIILNLPAFGRLPRGSRLERILQSPNYRDGQFRNLEASPMMTGDKSRLSGILEFLFRKKEGLRPDAAVPALKTDLRALDRDSNLLVWFGHSSYLLQAEGRRVLVAPVFRAAAPFSFLNRPFKGTDIYRPGDMPDVDLLVITHDHWDHLDYRTVTELKSRIGKVVCPLGVGEHFEYWGFEPEKIISTGTKRLRSATGSRCTACRRGTFRDADSIPTGRCGHRSCWKPRHGRSTWAGTAVTASISRRSAGSSPALTWRSSKTDSTTKHGNTSTRCPTNFPWRPKNWVPSRS